MKARFDVVMRYTLPCQWANPSTSHNRELVAARQAMRKTLTSSPPINAAMSVKGELPGEERNRVDALGSSLTASSDNSNPRPLG
jgi:hypothetical protein